MDFFADQARYHRRSHWLVALFVLAVLAVVAMVDVVVDGIYRFFATFTFNATGLSWPTLGILSLILLIAIALASACRIASLRGGGSIVAENMGATAVPAGTDRPAWRRLRDVVEEIAIASSTPVFNIFVMESEPGINAFAAGYTTADAAICVTQGCLDKLTRDELQGVIAHELSHVVNGDMRLNIRLMGMLYGIIGVGVIGHAMLESSMTAISIRGRDANNGPQALMFLGGLAAITFGAIGSLGGRLVQAAVARTRESLADAAAVQYTRQTLGIAGALKKIAALREGSRLRAAGKREVAHMLFGAHDRDARWFATHPPLRRRLRALGVPWIDAEIRKLADAWQNPPLAGNPASPLASLSGFAPAMSTAVMPATSRIPVSGAPRSASQAVGHPLPHDFDMAADLRDQLPSAVRTAAADPQQAEPLLLALVLDGRIDVRGKQMALITISLGKDTATAAMQSRELLAGLDRMTRLPLASLAFAALRRRPRPHIRKLLVTMDAMIQADHQVDLDEYCLMRLLSQQMQDLLDPSAGFRPGTKHLRDCRDSFARLCFVLASHGNPDDDAAAGQAYVLAMNHTLPDWQGRPAQLADWRAGMDKALQDLDALRAFDKQMIVDGLATAVGADGTITVAESELLRTVCAVLHCPLPPLHAQLTPAA